MRVFLSWSGHTSNAVAKALREWLRSVIQALDPWMSEEDIEKGKRWGAEIAKQLDSSKTGIICVTPENVSAPWLNFEAGAISKAVNESYVYTFLYGLKPSDVAGPLSQFQHTIVEKKDVGRLLHSFNNALEGNKLTTEQLDKTFERWWPDLQNALGNIQIEQKPRPRSDRELLEEMLELLREQARASTIFSGVTARPVLSLADTPYAVDLSKLAGDKPVTLDLSKWGSTKLSLPVTVDYMPSESDTGTARTTRGTFDTRALAAALRKRAASKKKTK